MKLKNDIAAAMTTAKNEVGIGSLHENPLGDMACYGY